MCVSEDVFERAWLRPWTPPEPLCLHRKVWLLGCSVSSEILDSDSQLRPQYKTQEAKSLN